MIGDMATRLRDPENLCPEEYDCSPPKSCACALMKEAAETIDAKDARIAQLENSLRSVQINISAAYTGARAALDTPKS